MKPLGLTLGYNFHISLGGDEPLAYMKPPRTTAFHTLFSPLSNILLNNVIIEIKTETREKIA